MSQSPGRGTRRKILDVSESEFAARGYDGAHLQEIASRVGVRKTALYHYFPSKAALYEAVLSRMLDALEQNVDPVVNAAPTPAAKLDAIIEATNRLMVEHPNYARLLVRVFVERPGDLRDGESAQRTTRWVVRRLDLLQTGIASGEFRKQSSRHLFMSMMGASVLYYAAAENTARLFGADDLFSKDLADWRFRESRAFLRHAVLAEPAREEG